MGRLLPPWALTVLVIGCSEPSATVPSAGPAHSEVTRLTAPPLESEVRVLGDADPEAALPLLVALHGRGSDEERFLSFFEGYPSHVRIASLQAPVDEGSGRAWWRFGGKTEEVVRRECSELVRRIVSTVRSLTARYATHGTPVLVGFSQGAMLAYLSALEHPEAFTATFPVAGVLFESWVPSQLPERFPPVVALHGEDDPIIPVAAGVRSVAALQQLGADARLRTFPGVPHWIMGDLKRALHREISDAFVPSGR